MFVDKIELRSSSVTTEHDQKREVHFNFENKPAKVKKIF